MIFDHPSRGTCNDDSCPYVYQCHCGCGHPTNVELKTRGDAVKGQPRVYRPGHNPNQGYGRYGMSAWVVMDDLEMAIRLAGRAKDVAHALDRHESWLSHVRAGRIPRIHISTAQRIAELVRGSRSVLPEPLTIRNRENKRAERARKAVA